MNYGTIYDINRKMLELFDDNGEITDFEAFTQLEMAREEKLKNAGLIIKETKVEIGCRKGVIAALEERIAAEKKQIGYRENTIARLEAYILEQLGDGENIDTPEVKIKRKLNPEKLVVAKEDEAKLIEWLETNHFDNCVKYSEPKLDKVAAKALCKAIADTSVPMPYARIVREEAVKVD